MNAPLLRRLRLLTGLALSGQGLLVVTRVLDHEAPLPLGWALLVVGLALLLLDIRSTPATANVPPKRRRRVATRLAFRDPPTRPSVSWALPGRRRRVATRLAFRDPPTRPSVSWALPGRRRLVLALGLFTAGGVVAYNAIRGSTLSTPELAILGYGIALCIASRRLDKLGRAVAYSFPLILAPLSLYAMNAALVAGVGATPLSAYIRYGLVMPMAGLLSWTGTDVMTLGDTVRLATPRGALFLSVGVVCAGLYAATLFLGVFALFAWETHTRGWRLAAYLGLGLLGLHLANVARLVLLALVGVEWGAQSLQTFHQHAGWVLFLVWAIVFWWLVLRRFEPRIVASR